jgi:hypothetical protein
MPKGGQVKRYRVVQNVEAVAAGIAAAGDVPAHAGQGSPEDLVFSKMATVKGGERLPSGHLATCAGRAVKKERNQSRGALMAMFFCETAKVARLFDGAKRFSGFLRRRLIKAEITGIRLISMPRLVKPSTP